MTLVGWLADAGNEDGTLGGAELTQAEFRRAAPDHVEVIDCPPGGVVQGLDRYVINNCVSYSRKELTAVEGGWKYWHDVGPHLSRPVWDFLTQYTRPIFVSPLQMEYMTRDGRFDNDSVGHPFYGSSRHLVPPTIPLDPFRDAAESAGERSGAVSIGPWMNPAKAPDEAAKWAAGNGGIDFYGEGPFAPLGSVAVSYEEMPEVLARYKTFVHLPREVEPFGRSTVEAWASGCEIVVNRLVGARHWIKEEPDKLESAAEDFWRLVLET